MSVSIPALRSSGLAVSGITAAALVLFLGIALRCMNYDLRIDEHMYVPPARLLDDLSLYTDFFYNHVPGSAWYFYVIGLVFGTDHLLAVGRIGVLIAWVCMIAAIFFVVRHLTRSTLMAGSALVLTLANELFLTQPGMAATNNFLPLPLTFLGISLFLVAVQEERGRPRFAFLAGVCLAGATGLKISAAAVIPVIAVASLLLPQRIGIGSRLRRITLPLAAGGILGALPILFYLLSDPGTFLAHVIGFHTGPHVKFWLDAAAERGPAMTLTEKALLAHELYLGSAILLAAGAIAVLAFLLAQGPSHRPDRGTPPRPLIYVVLACAAVATAMAFTPTPSFPQYFAPPLICVPLLLALLYIGIAPQHRLLAETATLALAFVALIAAVPRIAQDLRTIATPDRWTVNRVHAGGVEIANRMHAAGIAGKVATLAPIYPLEGGLPIYPELATGPFAYRVTDIADPALTAHFRTTSVSNLMAFLEADPPAAVLVGFDQELERPMQEFVGKHRYEMSPELGIRDRRGPAVLYLRPR